MLFYLSTDDILIGQVRYIDYDTESMYFLNALTPFLFKRMSFEHEKEIRAVIWNTKDTHEINNDITEIKIIEHGKLIKIDLNELIDSIYVSPTAPAWFYHLIKSILKKYNINKPVVHSQLYKNILSAENPASSVETIKVSKDLLEHFYKKDAYRINIETLKQERAKFREYENITKELNQVEDEILQISFIGKGKFTGKDALQEFSKSNFSKKELENIMNKSLFKKLYFISGKYDTIIKEIKHSTLTTEEKRILERKTIYSYTENMSIACLTMTGQFERFGINSQPYNIFINFTKNISTLTLNEGY